MKTKYTTLACFAFFGVLSNAGYANTDCQEKGWNDVTAYRLAVASNCAYFENAQEVKNCFREHINKSNGNGKEALGIFEHLPDNAIEIFTAPTGLTDSEINKFADYVNRIVKKLTDDDTVFTRFANPINSVILVKTPDGVIIAFRGTTPTVLDWVNNIYFSHLKTVTETNHQNDSSFLNRLYKDGRHYGFDKSLESLTNIIREQSEIWRSLNSNLSSKIYLTGHSKGGALATGATIDYADLLGERITTYTFEAARFFTAEVVNGTNNNNSDPIVARNKDRLKKILRFEYQYDIVPHVPLGQVTYQYLKELKENSNKDFSTRMEYRAINNLLELFGFSYKEIESNNINFLSAGKLAYVNISNELNCDNRDDMNYEDRFKKSVLENAIETHRCSVYPSLISREVKTTIIYVTNQHGDFPNSL